MILLKRQLIPNEAPPKLILETIMSVFPRGRYSIVFATSLWKPGSNSIFWKRKCNNKGKTMYLIFSLMNLILPICSGFFLIDDSNCCGEFFCLLTNHPEKTCSYHETYFWVCAARFKNVKHSNIIALTSE